jgi:uncharacterized membrane protein YfcA
VLFLILTYLLIGVLAGFLAGLLGVGGGIIIIPALAYVFSLQPNIPPADLMHMVIGSSLAAILATTLYSLRLQYRHGYLSWPIFLQLLPGIILGTLLGTVLAAYLNTKALRILFGAFMLLMALQLFFRLRESKVEKLPSKFNQWVAALFIGVSSGLLGVGGGAFTIPYLTYFKIGIRNAMAISTACSVVIAVTGMCGFIFTGWSRPDLPAWSSGYVYWPAVLAIGLSSLLFVRLGARLSHRLPVGTLRRVFAVFILLIGLQMLFQ